MLSSVSWPQPIRVKKSNRSQAHERWCRVSPRSQVYCTHHRIGVGLWQWSSLDDFEPIRGCAFLSFNKFVREHRTAVHMKLLLYNESRHVHGLLRPDQRPDQARPQGRNDFIAATQQKYINCFMRSCVGLKAWRNLSNVVTASVVLVALSDAEKSRPCCGS